MSSGGRYQILYKTDMQQLQWKINYILSNRLKIKKNNLDVSNKLEFIFFVWKHKIYKIFSQTHYQLLHENIKEIISVTYDLPEKTSCFI